MGDGGITVTLGLPELYMPLDLVVVVLTVAFEYVLEFELKAEVFREDIELSTDEGVLLRETGDGGEGELKERSRVPVAGDLLTSFDRKFGAMTYDASDGPR